MPLLKRARGRPLHFLWKSMYDRLAMSVERGIDAWLSVFVPKSIYCSIEQYGLMRLRYFLLVVCTLSLPLLSGYSMGDEMGGVFPAIPTEFTGDNISFSFDPVSWCVKDVRAYGVEMIERMCLPQGYTWNFENQGFDIRTKGYEFSVGNFSEPSLIYKSAGKSVVELSLFDDVSVDPVEMVLEKGRIRGEIISDGDLKMVEGGLQISFEKSGVFQIRFHLSGSQQSQSSGTSFKDALSDAFKLKKIGAEACIEKGKFTAVSYNNITIKPVEIGERRAVLRVSANESTGKCIYIHLNLNISNPKVLLDGSEIGEGSYYDALFSTGNVPVWNITVSEGERSLVVYIPHFSEHTLVVESTTVHSAQPTTPSSISPVTPIIGAVLISLMAAIALAVRKRKGP